MTALVQFSMTVLLAMVQSCTATGSAMNQPPDEPVDVGAPTGELRADDPQIDALLDELEQKADNLVSFRADVTYEKVEDLLGRREIRKGHIIFNRPQHKTDPDDIRFALLFDELFTGPIGAPLRRDAKQQHFIFDGRWLAEIDHARKQFIKRELVPPGERINLFRLGEGPIPLPIGQPKAEILQRFEVGRAMLPGGGFLAGLAADELDGLRLTPKPAAPESEEFESVDIFYDKVTRLPLGILARLPNGDQKVVLLENATRNPPLDEADLAKLDIQQPDPAVWKIDVILRDRQG